MENKKVIARLLDMAVEQVKLDRFLYTPDYPNEIKAWKHIARDNEELRRWEHRLFYPATGLMALISLTTELLVRSRFKTLVGLPGLVAYDTRFRKPVMPENDLLIQVKLLRNYKGRIGIFSGVIADQDGDIVAENISKGTIIKI